MSDLFVPQPGEIQVYTISLWQPWAGALVTPHNAFPNRGIKEYETRGWTTEVRGRILLHAAKTNGKDNRDVIDTNSAFRIMSEYLQPLNYGAIIGSVVISSVITSEHFVANGHNFSETPVTELSLGDWGPGRYGWKCEAPVLFDQPVKYKGQQGFWKVPLSAIPEKYHNLFITTAPLEQEYNKDEFFIYAHEEVETTEAGNSVSFLFNFHDIKNSEDIVIGGMVFCYEDSQWFLVNDISLVAANGGTISLTPLDINYRASIYKRMQLLYKSPEKKK